MDVETDLQLDRLTSSRAADDFAVGNLPKFCLSPDTQRSASVPPSSLANSSDSEGSSNEAKNEQLNFWINLKPIGAIEDNNSVVSGSSVEFEPSPRARLRRDSASSSCSSKQFGRSIRKMRVEQLKRDTNVFISEESDYEKEKLIRVASQVANSWEEFNLEDLDGPRQFDSGLGAGRIRANSLTEPVSIICPINLTASCSPSPSLSEKKQCFSPAMQQIVPSNFAFSPSPSPTPSPTRRSYYRSLSPIAVRPVTLGLKRKCDSDTESFASAPKKLNYGAASNSSCASTPDRSIVPLQHPQFLRHSLSVNSLDSDSSNSTLSSADLGLSLLTSSNGNTSTVYGNSVIFSMAHIPTDSFNVTFPQSLVKSLEDDISGPIQLLQTPTALIPSPVPLSTESEDLLEGLPPLPDEVMQDVSSADPTKLQCRLQSTEQFTCEVNPASDSPLIDGLLIEEDTVQSTSDLSTSSLAVLGDVGGIETESI